MVLKITLVSLDWTAQSIDSAFVLYTLTVSCVFHYLSSTNCKTLYCVKITSSSDARSLCKGHSGLQILWMLKLGKFCQTRHIAILHFQKKSSTQSGHPVQTCGFASHHVKNIDNQGFLKCCLKFQSFQPPISDELLPCKSMSSGRGLCTERARGRLAQWLEWQGKKQCDSYFSQRRGGESRVRDVMPQCRFSVTEKFQHAHIPPSLMDNPYCEGWSACQSKYTAIANSWLSSLSLAEGLSCDLVLGGRSWKVGGWELSLQQLVDVMALYFGLHPHFGV